MDDGRGVHWRARQHPPVNVIFLAAVIRDDGRCDNRRRNLNGDRLIFGPSGIVGVRVKVGVLNRE